MFEYLFLRGVEVVLGSVFLLVLCTNENFLPLEHSKCKEKINKLNRYTAIICAHPGRNQTTSINNAKGVTLTNPITHEFITGLR